MDRIRPVAVLGLAVWSLVLWTGRLGLAWGTTGSTGSKVLATVPVAIFVALGVALAVVVLSRASAALTDAGRRFAVAVAVWTVAYWVVRLPFILTDSHGAGFKGVHAVLAVLSWTVAGLALRSLRRDPSTVVPAATAPGVRAGDASHPVAP
jgi:hypothetical protein